MVLLADYSRNRVENPLNMDSDSPAFGTLGRRRAILETLASHHESPGTLGIQKFLGKLDSRLDDQRTLDSHHEMSHLNIDSLL